MFYKSMQGKGVKFRSLNHSILNELWIFCKKKKIQNHMKEITQGTRLLNCHIYHYIKTVCPMTLENIFRSLIPYRCIARGTAKHYRGMNIPCKWSIHSPLRHRGILSYCYCETYACLLRIRRTEFKGTYSQETVIS